MRPLRRRAACAALALMTGLSLALLMSFGRSAAISGQLELEPVSWLNIAAGNTGVGLLLATGLVLLSARRRAPATR